MGFVNAFAPGRLSAGVVSHTELAACGASSSRPSVRHRPSDRPVRLVWLSSSFGDDTRGVRPAFHRWGQTVSVKSRDGLRMAELASPDSPD